MNPTPFLVAATEAARLLGISERAFHNLRHSPDFPKPVVLSERVVRWRTKDLEDFAGKLKPAVLRSEPDQLQRGRLRRRAKAGAASGGSNPFSQLVSTTRR